MKDLAAETKDEIFDVAVIGAGASGSVAVHELCSKGLRVALLDAGSVDHEQLPDLNPLKARIDREYPIQCRSEAFKQPTEKFFVKDSEAPYAFSKNANFVWIRSRAMGGRMNLWTGECYRLSDLDFKAATHDGLGVDWPITHSDLEPDYRRAERLLGIQGHRDELPILPDGEIVRDKPLDANEEWVQECLGKRGVPVILDRLATRRAGKAPTLKDLIHQAEGTGLLTHFPSTIAQSMTLSKDGSIGSVTAIQAKDSTEIRVKARFFVLCASTIESTRILLNSGLEKSSGYKVLGKYLNDHIGGPRCLKIEGRFNDRGTPYESGRQRILYIPRHQNTLGDGKLWPYKRGYTTRIILQRYNQFQIHFTLTAFGEPLPNEKNTVTLDPALRDKWGGPAARIHFEPTENDVRMFECMKWDLKKIAADFTREPGSEITHQGLGRIEPGLCNHEVGTARMGDDPQDSFLNSHSRCHDIDNLYVTDGAGFTSLGTVNPTLTLMALTYRACRNLAKNF